MVAGCRGSDNNYAYCVLAASFTMYMLSIGSYKSYGILYTEMKDYFGTGSGATAWVGSVCYMLLLGLGPLTNWLAVKYTFRTVGVVGGLLTCSGYALCMVISKLEYMYLTFGVIVGFGYSFTFTTCSTIINFYFESNRALANGIVVSGSGIGALILPFVYRYLIQTYSLKGAFLIAGAILLHICPAACLFVQPKVLQNTKQSRYHKKEGKETPTNRQSLLKTADNCEKETVDLKYSKSRKWIPDLKCSLFRNPLFLAIAIASALGANGFINNLILIPSHTKDLGYDKTEVSLTLSVMGGCEMFARIVLGWFADRNFVKRRYIFIFSMFISSAFCFIVPHVKQLWFIIVYSAIIGIFPGSFWGLMPVFIIDAVGMGNFAPAFGLVIMCMASGALFCQPIVGWLEDVTGNWNASFYLTGSLLLLAGLIMTFEPLINDHNGQPVQKSSGEKNEPEDKECLNLSQKYDRQVLELLVENESENNCSSDDPCHKRMVYRTTEPEVDVKDDDDWHPHAFLASEEYKS